MMRDDSLRPLAPSVSGAPRAITPNKLYANVEASRNPIKGTMKLSAGDQTTPTRARSTSRRRQRQWENNNFFGLEAHIDKKDKESPIFLYHGADDDTFLTRGQQYPFKVEWKSKMGELFASKNIKALESFRNVSHSAAVEIANTRSQRKSRCDEWAEAEAAYLRMEKRLRSILSSASSKSYSVIPILKSLETCIVFAAVWRVALPLECICAELRAHLTQAPSMDSDGNLVMPLRDSAFHRLLLHGVCQFYCLKSKTVVVKKTKEKVTVVTIPPSSSSWSESLREMLSLAGYLSMSQGDRVVSVPETVTMPSEEGKDYAYDNDSNDNRSGVDKVAAAMTMISEGDEGFLSISDVVVRLEASCRVTETVALLSDREESDHDYVLVAKD